MPFTPAENEVPRPTEPGPGIGHWAWNPIVEKWFWMTDSDEASFGWGEPVPPPDMINHPPHYTGHPSGVECIDIVEHYGFNIGNTIKYLWRAGLKGDALEDLKKARWYLDREIQKREKASASD